jgi:hypothetical protein
LAIANQESPSTALCFALSKSYVEIPRNSSWSG